LSFNKRILNVVSIVTILTLLLITIYTYYKKEKANDIVAQQTKQPQYTAKQYIQDHAPKLGKTAPPFILPTINGDIIDLSKNENKPTVINFWATWCTYCHEEMPIFQKYYKQYNKKTNFIMINATFSESEENVKEYIKSNNYSFPVALDIEGDISQLYASSAYPQTYILDKNNKIVFHYIGKISKKTLEEEINKVIQN
jgi:thiol-disulfide isomerase/thioredoxin